MSPANQQSLRYFLERFSSDEQLAEIGKQLTNADSLYDLIEIYSEAIPIIERNIWASLPDDETIDHYQNVFRAQEILIQEGLIKKNNRHKFYIIIPVADRPIHLQQCLKSLLTLCHLYLYGGKVNQQYQKIAVIVADDSKNPECIDQHRDICDQFTDNGLTTEYFGINEQIDQIKKLGTSTDKLHNILGDYACRQDPADFYHKGAAITRNIAYLRLGEIAASSDEKLIFYFIDSDQEFKIKLATEYGQKNIYAVNYFYHLNEIFNRNEATILTGKVVGDPPVSPAVMAGNFQSDVIDFMQQISTNDPMASCHFHDAIQPSNDAAYHDMADLFGFKKPEQPYQYACTVKGIHSHLDCFNDFSKKLNRFFDGEHPTRVTYFNYHGALSDTIAARTIYTGNFAFKPECLKYFISFATLKLRMAGPVLGRIIKSEIGDQFVSANLPMLHRRTTDETGESEFRPGVNRDHNIVVLSDEFERQFFGDVMLFTIEKLVASGYPNKPLDKQSIESVLIETEQALHRQYESKQHKIIDDLNKLKSIFNDENNWWNNHPGTAQAKLEIQRFINSIEHNFGTNSPGHALINSAPNQGKRHNVILQAIMSYKDDRHTWEAILK